MPPAATQSSTDLASRRRTCQRRRSHRTCSRPTSCTWVLLRLEALAWPRFQSIEYGLLASLLTLPTAPATYNMSSGGSQTLPHAHCMPPYRWRSKCCGRTPMTEDMSTRPRPRLRAARLTLGRWCALQAVRRTAVAPEPTGASAEGSSPAPLLCDVLSPFGYPGGSQGARNLCRKLWVFWVPSSHPTRCALTCKRMLCRVASTHVLRAAGKKHSRPSDVEKKSNLGIPIDKMCTARH